MRWIVLLFLLITFMGFTLQPKEDITRPSTISFGEHLEYRMYLGIFTVGKGITTVDKNYYIKNKKACYKVEAFMETLGMATWVSKVRDYWGAYIDTSELVTHESYRKLKEGRYRLNEVITYDHEKSMAVVKDDKHSGSGSKPKIYPIPNKVRDIVAGFMYLRIIDFSKYKVKDTLIVSGFFEDKSYKFKIIYFGKETIETTLGKIACYKLIPIMPDNQVFRGENSVTAWLSADSNQVPVKVEAKMFIGHAGTELVSFKGLKSQFKIAQ